MHEGTQEDHELGPEDATMFRAVGARLNHLSQDKPDIGEDADSGKELQILNTTVRWSSRGLG